MEERKDNWYHLQEHSTPPPRELLEKLRRRLATSPAAGRSTDNDPTPRTDAAFRLLGNHSIPPPANLRPSVMHSITAPAKNNLKRWFAYTAAAACLLFFSIGFILYRRADNTRPRLANKIEHAVPAKAAAPTPAGDSLPTLATTQSAAPDSITASPIQLSPPALTVHDDRFTLSENSPLLTFTSYRYPALGASLNRPGNEAVHIHLDQYTDIALSPIMVAALRDLFDSRPDGVLSRKARKTREKMEKWNTQDKKAFDLKAAANPLDAIDLGEFLFPPLFSFSHRSAKLPATTTPIVATADSQTATAKAPLTVSYSLTIITKRSSATIAETYNGGIQTLFAQDGYSRLRLASLMRIQSLLLTPRNPIPILVVESVKPRQEQSLTPAQWSTWNEKYSGMTQKLVEDSLVILGYRCKKALVDLRNGHRLTAWYTPAIQSPAQSRMEPAFAGIPGLVLRYEYNCRRKTIRYTATNLSRRPIAPSVFVIPQTP